MSSAVPQDKGLTATSGRAAVTETVSTKTTQRGGKQCSGWAMWFWCCIPLQIVLCVGGCGHVGVSAQFVQAYLHVCAIKCMSECVVCVPFTLLPPSPLHSNSVENTHPTEPAVSCLVQESQKKMVMSKETLLPVMYCWNFAEANCASFYVECLFHFGAFCCVCECS